MTKAGMTKMELIAALEASEAKNEALKTQRKVARDIAVKARDRMGEQAGIAHQVVLALEEK